MKMVIAIFRTGRLSAVKQTLIENGFDGITVTAVKGCGSEKGVIERYRGSTFVVDLLDKVKLEVVVSDEDVDKVVDVISDSAKTGEVGDGKIFVLNIEEAIRIRTNEKGLSALEKR